MDLLKYLEPMKNLPERFSNLAFWRGVRKLRDEVVNAFEYVDSWGENIESNISHLLTNISVMPIRSIQGDEGGAKQIGNNKYAFYVHMSGTFDICDIPPNAVGVSVTCHISYTVASQPYYLSTINYTLYKVANGKLQGSWYGNNAVFYDPVLTSENYKSFTNPYLIYDVIFTLKK
jgi:hypothetical protein